MKNRRRLRSLLIFENWFAPLIAASFLLINMTAAQNVVLPSLGVALTPAHFPKHSSKDVEEMFSLGKQIGGVAVFIYQWSQPDFKQVAANVMKAARANGLTPIIAVSPTRLEGTRGELDLPQSVRQNAGRNPSFKDKNVHEAYIRDVMELAQLKPDYLCLATEINLLALKDVNEYIAFGAVYKRLYPEIKKVSPSTKVFVSFQWEFLKAMDVKEPQKVQEWTKMIDIFRPELDLIAFTSYPAVSFDKPASIPADYYDGIYDHIKRSDTVIFMEIGWPTTGKGTEASQVEFIRRLPTLMKNLKPQILVWSLLHDVQGSSLGPNLSTTGLYDNTGKPKSGVAAFKELR